MKELQEIFTVEILKEVNSKIDGDLSFVSADDGYRTTGKSLVWYYKGPALKETCIKTSNIIREFMFEKNGLEFVITNDWQKFGAIGFEIVLWIKLEKAA